MRAPQDEGRGVSKDDVFRPLAYSLNSASSGMRVKAIFAPI
jgi:hypothetical protein